MPVFDIFDKVITTAHAHKSGVIFHFFPRAFKQEKINALRPKMTKIASRGGGGPALTRDKSSDKSLGYASDFNTLGFSPSKALGSEFNVYFVFETSFHTNEACSNTSLLTRFWVAVRSFCGSHWVAMSSIEIGYHDWIPYFLVQNTTHSR